MNIRINLYISWLILRLTKYLANSMNMKGAAGMKELYFLIIYDDVYKLTIHICCWQLKAPLVRGCTGWALFDCLLMDLYLLVKPVKAKTKTFFLLALCMAVFVWFMWWPSAVHQSLLYPCPWKKPKRDSPTFARIKKFVSKSCLLKF